MSKVMRPVSFSQLLNWVISEFEDSGSVFGIDKRHFYRAGMREPEQLGDESYETVLGPAAGPHTQCAQNIVAAYLTGSRFFELKTVQVLDELEIGKPCIEAQFEGYNTEWSTELSVEEACREYIKAWFIIHFVKQIMQLSEQPASGFLFNMSVGYDLKGVKSGKIDKFIETMKESKDDSYFRQCKKELSEFICRSTKWKKYQHLPEQIPSKISASITLSTMHGCPPEEQESICSYLLKEKRLNTFVKLNPTLLGYEFVKKVLDRQGYKIELKETTFSADLQFKDAVAMLKRLNALAEAEGLTFGVKLTNTLPVVNRQGILPGEEMYMSGKALFPLALSLAARLENEFEGRLVLSYCGGADYRNAMNLMLMGIKPITMATNLLKPGGYQRISQICSMLEHHTLPEAIELEYLLGYAHEAINRKAEKWRGSEKINEELPMYDCVLAACRKGCPVEQDIPEYIRLVETGEYARALEVIHERNALPHITGWICEQPCQHYCTRLDYELPLSIRAIKKLAAEKGYAQYLRRIKQKPADKSSVAVMGAGPAGLSAALHLRRAGYQVKVYEKESAGGGLVRYVIPGFRLPEEVIDKDIKLLEASGVELAYNSEVPFAELAAQHQYVILAVGAGKSKELKLGNKENVYNALEFLREYKQNPENITAGQTVAVIGGGNSAMDSARAALRLPGVESVKLIYRRTKQEMPADREEFENALTDGVKFLYLLQPVQFEPGRLVCQPLELGERDESGRAKPVPTGEENRLIKADMVIMAIGEEVDSSFLADNNIQPLDDCRTNRSNVFLVGDARSGPSSVVEALSDGIKAAETIIKAENPKYVTDREESAAIDLDLMIDAIAAEKGIIKYPKVNIHEETERCLGCDLVCNKCTEVCPNRANVAIRVKSGFLENYYQIVHLDQLCNECGNCETFCPWQGKPYKDKFTLYSSSESFLSGTNSGVFYENDKNGQVRELEIIGRFRISENNFYVEDDKGEEANLRPETVAVIKTLARNYQYLTGLREDDI